MFEISIWDVLPFSASILFLFWPLIIITPLRVRRNIIPAMFALWIFMLSMRLFAGVYSADAPFHEMFDPWYTVAFGITGVVLFGLLFGRRYIARWQLRRKIDSAVHPNDLLEISPREFEEMAVELFEGMGHKAKRTGRSGDHGVDVIVKTQNREKWIVQCKRWRGNVGEPVIRDFYGTMLHEKADKGAVITTGKFSEAAKEWAKGKPMTLMEGEAFLEYVQLSRNKVNAEIPGRLMS